MGNKKKSGDLQNFLENIVKQRLNEEEYSELMHLIDNLLINALDESFSAGKTRGGLAMAQNKDVISKINEINMEISYHENEKAKHQRKIEKLRKEKSILMSGEWYKNGREQNA